MSDKVYVAARKGLFEVARRGATWQVADTHFLGDPVSAVFARGDSVLVALDLGHFGTKLWRRDGAQAWREVPAPVFPPKPQDVTDDPHPWSLGKIWIFEAGGVRGRLWAGTMPGGLFRSDDDGETWSLNTPLWTMSERRQWFGVAGGEQPGIHSVLVDPHDPADIRVGVSTGGVWASRDAGASWRIINKGMHNGYMPPERQGDPITQDVHRLARCAAVPEVVWCQHHSSAYRSTDGGENWSELTALQPSRFGFAVAAHPRDPNTAWFVPAIKDEKRYPVDGKLVVARTRDGGKSFEALSRGLPQTHAYDLVYRHAFAIDASGERLAMGSTSGGLWFSENGGESWASPDARLPPIAAVRFADA